MADEYKQDRQRSGHWVLDDQHGQVWCDIPDCEPLADAEHPHWQARQAALEHYDGQLPLPLP